MLKQYATIIFALFLWPGFGDAISAVTTKPFPPQPETEKGININTASVVELQTLPGIGPKLAERVIAHRQKHGAFKRPQDIIIVRGFSANRYRQIAHLIRT